MNELPKGWTRIAIGDACRLVNGRAFKPTDWTSEGLPIVRIQNLNSMTAAFNRYAGDVDAKFLIRSGELLFAWSGTPGTSFGAHVWERGAAILNQHIFRVLDYEKHYDRDFLRFAINDRLGHLIGEAHGGAGLAHVTKPKFEATEIALPPLNEQRRIVAKLEALQDRSRRAREALDAVPSLLEKLRQSILAAAFRGDLTRDWRAKTPDVEPADMLLARIRTERRRKWEEAELAKLKAKGKPPTDDKWKSKYKEPEPLDIRAMPDLPEGWCWASPREVLVWASGDFLPRTAQVTGPYPVYGGNGVSGSHSEYLVAKPTLVVGRVGADCGNVHVTDRPAWVTDNAIYASVIPESLSLDFWRIALSRTNLRSHARGGGQPFVSQETLNSVVVPLPPRDEQEVLLRTIRELEARLLATENAVRSELARLSSLDRSLLAKAFRGELVPQDPADEPADVMLARFRSRAAPSSTDTPAVSTKRTRAGKRKAG